MNKRIYLLGLEAGALMKSAYIGGVAGPQTVESQQSVVNPDTSAGQQHTAQPRAPAGTGVHPLRKKRTSKRIGTTLAPMFGMDGRTEAKKDTLKQKDQD